MKAAIYQQFGKPFSVDEVPDPVANADGVVLRVLATGICLSDWHGWMGHDKDIRLPQIPGHEIAGVVEQVGAQVRNWKIGDRVTVPFVCGCGRCPQCETGNQQVCDYQFQPGFTHWGSFAEYVAIEAADINLVALPEAMDSVSAASLGCRFATAYRAIVDQGKVKEGHWVAIHGCGGVGLSALMISLAYGAQVVAVDIHKEKLEFAKKLGAHALVLSEIGASTVDKIMESTHGGAHLSLDAIGSTQALMNSVSCLRKRGRHVQVGLMTGQHQNPSLPMDKIISDELEIFGSHGMQAHRYPEMLDLILAGKLSPGKLVGKTISLEESPAFLMAMDRSAEKGITVIDKF